MGEVEIQQLINGCLRQQRSDQKKLYKTYYSFAMGICLRYAGNRYEAAEMMNDGFLKVFNNLHKYDPDRAFMPWLGRVMMNTSLDHYRKSVKLKMFEDIEEAENISHDELPDRKLNYDDLIAVIHRLPPAYRTVFNLFAIEGYTHEEIAESLNISVGTSKSNLSRAREKLKLMIINADRTCANTNSNHSGGFDILKFSALSINVFLILIAILR